MQKQKSLEMSDHQDQVSNSLNEVKSKNKNQNATRQYGCPCGKEYLSYPALFTHIKQKHGGKAPGVLKKPKTQKARGRPRLPTNMQQDNSVQQYNPQQQLKRLLSSRSIVYNQSITTSQGNKTCQDMASTFYLQQQSLQQQQKKILVCFINYMKFFATEKYGDQYWTDEEPHQIIDISNQMVREFQEHKQAFPLTRELLIQLLFVLFRWMYKNKWTDHKLVKRASNDTTQTAAPTPGV